MIHICCWKSSQINTVFNFPAGNTESQQYGDEIQQSTNINIFFFILFCIIQCQQHSVGPTVYVACFGIAALCVMWS